MGTLGEILPETLTRAVQGAWQVAVAFGVLPCARYTGMLTQTLLPNGDKAET